MSATIGSDISGLFGSLKHNGVEAFRFGQDSSGQLAGFRNLFINGDFSIAQRGASVSVGSSPVYTADRWWGLASGANVTVQQADYDTDTGLVVSGAGGNTGVSIGQRVESSNVRGKAGKVATVSGRFYHTDNVAIQWTALYANTKDNFAAKTVIGTGVLNLVSGQYTPQSFSFTLPSAAGTTSNGVEIQFSLSSLGAGKQFGLRKMQFEEGSIATPFEQRPIGLELALCQRYYATGNLAFFNNASVSVTVGGNTRYPITMRATPTITLGAGVAEAATSFDFRSYQATTSAGQWYTTTWTASAEL